MLALLALGLTLAACSITGVPLNPPSVTVPSIQVPTFSAPSIGLTPPAIGLTLTIGQGSAPMATPAVPAPAVSDQAIKWLIYGLVALLIIILVVAAFARLLRRTDTPHGDHHDM